MSQPQPIVAEENVSQDYITGLLAGAGMTIHKLEGGRMLIVVDGLPILFLVEEEKGLLLLACPIGLRESVPMAKKQEWTNTLNRNIDLLKFHLSAPNILNVSYQMSYTGGLNLRTFIRTLQMFQALYDTVAKLHDSNRIIELAGSSCA